ncbi:hypothetical protein IMSAG249_00095 [Lachnospiraceae bacterium]|nr:hypothetical protein IMSAG249_00095 [Lachnospiraceae bacterium]
MLGAIKDRLSEFSVLKEGLISCISDTGKKGMQTFPQKQMTKKIRLTQIEEEIEELLSKVSGASDVLMKYIDEKVSELDTERKALQEEIVTANVIDTEGRLKQITNHVKAWETLSFEDRQAVVDTLIKVIRIADGNIEITWNI